MKKDLLVTAEFKPRAGWRLLIGTEDVTRFIPRCLLLKPMGTRKRYSEGFRGYSYRDWIRKNKWVKALADSKEDRLRIYAAIRKVDF